MGYCELTFGSHGHSDTKQPHKSKSAKARLEKATNYMGGGVHDALRVLVINKCSFVSSFVSLLMGTCN